MRERGGSENLRRKRPVQCRFKTPAQQGPERPPTGRRREMVCGITKMGGNRNTETLRRKTALLFNALGKRVILRGRVGGVEWAKAGSGKIIRKGNLKHSAPHSQVRFKKAGRRGGFGRARGEEHQKNRFTKKGHMNTRRGGTRR